MTGTVSVKTAISLFLVTAMISVVLSSCQPSADSGSRNREPGDAVPDMGNGSSRKEVFPGWENPLAVLVLTGDQHGYLEPCGCSERQSGGLARRGDLLRQIREDRGWPVTAFDVGGTLDEQRVNTLQSRLKFSTILDGLNTLGYQGLALGKEELMLGGTELYSEHASLESKDGFDVPFLGQNVTIFGTKDLGTPKDYRIVEVGDVKVGVTAIVGATTHEKLEAAGVTRNEEELRIDDPASRLPEILDQMKEEGATVFVLLSHSTIEESTQLAQQFPQFQVVVTAGSAEDPRKDPVWVGETLLVQVGKKGKNAAVVGIFPENELKFQLLELDMDRFENLPVMRDLMASYQTTLENRYPELIEDLTVSTNSEATYVGADQCKKCHTFAYSVWSKTRHAHAFESLSKGREGQEATWISRIHDPECLCCHTTGWDPQRARRSESGFASMEQTPHLAGQQCENCHGPGSRHVQFEQAWKQTGELTDDTRSARADMRLTLTQARENVCNRCHDLDNSPHFDFDKYWPKVNHSGRKD
ncbi:MAG: hypothetical protein KDA80_07445 [Planctomycetaceae bacterium]|nr:hypothetical protein [Planctomycetaceae bacterium]